MGLRAERFDPTGMVLSSEVQGSKDEKSEYRIMNVDMAAKRHKKRKSKILYLLFSIGYEITIRKFRLFTSSSMLNIEGMYSACREPLCRTVHFKKD